MPSSHIIPRGVTGVLALADGTVLFGEGLGKAASAVGEVCFNTAMTGYQEILTDPSYAAQIVAFTFPHIGNVGANDEDIEASSPAAHAAARGAILRAPPTAPSNWRASDGLSAWLEKRGVIGLAGVDTRALTARIRELGMPNAVIAHNPQGRFDIEALLAQAAACLARDLPDTTPGGFWTPASLMGEKLIARLEAHAGLSFELVPA